MTRQLLPVSGYTDNPTSEVASNVVGLVEFVQIDLPTGTLYLTNAQKAFTYGGNTYTPVTSTGAPFGYMSNYNETTDSIPRPMTLQFSGVDQTIINNLVSNDIQWISITWSLGLLDNQNNLINGTPFLVCPTYLGDCTITLGSGTGTIIINCENLLADMQNRNSGQFQTVQDQQQRGASGNTTFSTDTFFSYAASIMFTWIYWGQLGPISVGTTGGVGGGPIGGGGIGIIKQPF